MTKKLKISLILITVILMPTLIKAKDEKVKFTDLSGTCQAGSYNKLWGTALGWNRFDISWAECEPHEGKWNEKYYRKMLNKIEINLDHGIKVLPVLAYAPGWASIKPEYIFKTGNKKVEYKFQENSNYKVTSWKMQKGKYIKTKESESSKPRIPLSEDKTQAWLTFIRKVVSDLRKPPYNIEYFQIWNEAHAKSGFWDGSLDTYMQQIHIPAATEIKKLGGKVVYGGYPCCGTIGGLAKLLDRNKAWGTIDIIDIHYFSVQWMEYLRRNAEERGFKDMGVWQTEIGFHRKYYYIPKIYPAFIYWGLKNNWKYVDRYKLFFFAYGSPNAPKAYGYGKCLLAGKELTPHGQALKVLADLYNGCSLLPYDDVKSAPELKLSFKDSCMTALKCDNRIIITLVLDKKLRDKFSSDKEPEIALLLRNLSKQDIVSVQKVEMFGSVADITERINENDPLSLTVPVKTIAKPKYKNSFLKEPENFIRPVFYIVITLK